MKKIIRLIFVLIIVLIGLVFVFRWFNDQKYKSDVRSSSPEYYKEVNNIALYPTDIEGVRVEYIDEGRLQGFRMIPDKKLYQGTVLCFGGSEGSPNFEGAARLAQQGYETFALFMFGMKNQPKTLAKIPLEQFEDVMQYLDKNVEDNRPISVLAASKGAEYALNLASKYQEIDHLILQAPSSYNFAGLDFEDYASSWTYEGKELPYIDIQKGSFPAFIQNIVIAAITKAPISYKETYDSAVKNDSTKDEKLIPVREIKADIIMIVGEEDSMWDSLAMANEIKNQNPKAKIYSFEGAGHIFSGNGILNLENSRIKTGGSLENNEKAGEESIKIIDQFLKENHQMDKE